MTNVTTLLRNGNPRGNPNLAPRCGAHTRAGRPCRASAMANGRCRMHGDASTGPRSEAGRERIRAAHTTHGYYGPEGRALRERCRLIVAQGRIVATLLKSGIPMELWGLFFITTRPRPLAPRRRVSKR